MSGTKVNNYSNIDTNIQALQLTTDKVFKGLHQLTLTEMDTTTVPAIAAGSVVECNGTLIKYDTEEAIVTTDPHTSATVADGAVYIVIKGADLTAYFTATAPTWSDAKQGYYGTTTWANDRYVGFTRKSTSSYIQKKYIKEQAKNLLPKSITRMRKTAGQTITGSNLTVIAFDAIDIDINNEGSTVNSRFTALSPGYYEVVGKIQGAVSSPYAGDGIFCLYKNASLYSFGTRFRMDSSDATYTQTFKINDILYLDSGDYVDLRWNQFSTPTFTLLNNSASHYFNIKKIDD